MLPISLANGQAGFGISIGIFVSYALLLMRTQWPGHEMKMRASGIYLRLASLGTSRYR